MLDAEDNSVQFRVTLKEEHLQEVRRMDCDEQQF